MTDQKNLVLAIVVSIAILLGFQYFYEAPRRAAQQAQLAQQQAEQTVTTPTATAPAGTNAAVPPGGPATLAVPATASPAPAAIRDRDAVLRDSVRIPIKTPRLRGSIATVGARLDDLSLADYHETTDKASPAIELLSPVGAAAPYYAEFGWIPAGENRTLALPDDQTVWTSDGGTLTPDHPVVLRWDNGQGLVFERQIAIDANYMFTVVQRVHNNTDQPVTLLPYGLVSRHGTPPTLGFRLLHEGPLGVFDGRLTEYSYTDFKGEQTFTKTSTGGWIGITDKYWLVSLVPDQKEALTARFVHTLPDHQDRWQVDTLGDRVVVAAGATGETSARLFAGAKQVRLLDSYAKTLGIPYFDRAIDFGWFYFLTKPIFYALDYLGRLFGNFGIAILVFTLFVKIVLFPIANRSYRSMSKMKALQPQVKEIRDRFGDDKERMSQEMMALYKREKANPVSGCLPMVIQIPVFFSLYKVLFVTIEMRHAPFFGWIHDLSAPDPTSFVNLFGLLPFDAPTMLHLGAWPLLMGVTMFLQQKLNPAPPDPTQAKIMMAMPIVFTFMLANFSAGLVIYWAWNNSLSILQQWLIMRRTKVGSAVTGAKP
ncbi:MAG: membrane protein insertase YidC [Azospirillaceae bacterium]|nr:membrane protein insertase YidC [Azospirillaceae bacterium]